MTMTELKLFIRGLIVTIMAYTAVTFIMFIYTDINIILRVIGIGVCIIGQLSYGWSNTERIFAEWLKQINKD